MVKHNGVAATILQNKGVKLLVVHCLANSLENDILGAIMDNMSQSISQCNEATHEILLSQTQPHTDNRSHRLALTQILTQTHPPTSDRQTYTYISTDTFTHIYFNRHSYRYLQHSHTDTYLLSHTNTPTDTLLHR